MKVFVVIVCLFAGFLIADIQGHVILYEPVGRASRWRVNSSAPVNYDDYSNFCGGIGQQWQQNNGKCGLCGDSYSSQKPRPTELGGKYGEGVIVRSWRKESKIEIKLKVAANHKGFNFFEICSLDANKKESEGCFSKNRLRTADGKDKHYLGEATGLVKITVFLPKNLICRHCVLRWTYRAGNNWGSCEDGSEGMGCGPQEHYKQCADISITGGDKSFREGLNLPIVV